MDEVIGSHIAFEGSYEPGLELLLERALDRGSHFVDIGANIGHFSLLAAAVLGPDGLVSAVEAVPGTAKLLHENVLLNGFEQRISVYEAAAWDKEDMLEFHLAPAGRSGMSSVRPVRNSTARCRVAAKPLDDLIPFQTYPVAVMKFDVEGAEYKALQGAARIINEQRPVVFLELSRMYLEQVGNTAQEVVHLLTGRFKMLLYRYNQDGGLIPLTFCDTAEAAGEFQYNIFCLPEERLTELAPKFNLAK